MFFEQTIQNINRSGRVIQVLMKYGFEDFVSNSPLINFVPKRSQLNWVRKEQPVLSLSRWERMRMAAEELGPTFIKFAQVLSNRPDLLPAPLIAEFEKLQDRVPPFPFKIVRQIIEKDTGKTIEELFDDFSEIPLASASIGQVHKAKLKNGKEVVVKVQRPEVKHIVDLDLSIFNEVAQRGETFFKRYGIINVMDVVKTFERTMLHELDYTHEARNIQRFKSFYRKRTDFYVPAVYKEYSTERVLVIEFISGCKITDVRQMKAWGLNPHDIAAKGLDIYLSQIFEYGYFHADPHPGNVFIRKDGVVCLIDFGMVGKLMQRDKFAFASIFVAMAKGDARSMATFFRKLSIEDSIDDMRMFEYDLHELIEDQSEVDVRESSLADTVQRLQKIIYQYRMRVPGDVFLIFRALAILEGIGKMIHPTMDTMAYIRPYGAKILKDQFSPQNIAEELYHRTTAWTSLANSLPFEIKTLLKKTRKGQLRIEIDHMGYDPFLRRLDRMTNRLALTFVMVALILGSSIVMTAEKTPRINLFGGEVPYIGILGYGIATFLGILLLYAVFRSRRY